MRNDGAAGNAGARARDCGETLGGKRRGGRKGPAERRDGERRGCGVVEAGEREQPRNVMKRGKRGLGERRRRGGATVGNVTAKATGVCPHAAQTTRNGVRRMMAKR